MMTMTASTTTTTTSATKSYLQRGETLVAAETSKSEIVDLREQKGNGLQPSLSKHSYMSRVHTEAQGKHRIKV